MKYIKLNLFSLFIVSMLMSLPAYFSYGKDILKEKQISQKAIPNELEIQGFLLDVVDLNNFLNELEVSNPQSDQELGKCLEKIGNPEPAKGITVRVKSKLFTQETVTNSNGVFKFSGLPPGIYDIVAEAPRSSGIKGSMRTAIAKGTVNLKSSIKGIKLQLSTTFIDIKGKISNLHDSPISGVTVTAIEDINDPSGMYNPKSWSAISDSNGYYELKGLPATGIYRIAGYLQSGTLHGLKAVVIKVEENKISNKSNIQKIYLVSEDQLVLARRLLKILSQIAQKNGGDALIEKGDILLPSSKENVITGIDFKLHE